MPVDLDTLRGINIRTVIFDSHHRDIFTGDSIPDYHATFHLRIGRGVRLDLRQLLLQRRYKPVAYFGALFVVSSPLSGIQVSHGSIDSFLYIFDVFEFGTLVRPYVRELSLFRLFLEQIGVYLCSSVDGKPVALVFE